MAQENNELEQLKKDLEDCKIKSEEYLNGWKRERADFLNHKKDEAERLSSLTKYSNEGLVLKILPILDNLYLAESHIPEELKESNWNNGFSQIKKQLCEFLEREGVEEIKTIGETFDPNSMEAIESAATESSDETKEVVIEEMQKGYTMNGKLIRPARVKISKI